MRLSYAKSYTKAIRHVQHIYYIYLEIYNNCKQALASHHFSLRKRTLLLSGFSLTGVTSGNINDLIYAC